MSIREPWLPGSGFTTKNGAVGREVVFAWGRHSYKIGADELDGGDIWFLRRSWRLRQMRQIAMHPSATNTLKETPNPMARTLTPPLASLPELGAAVPDAKTEVDEASRLLDPVASTVEPSALAVLSVASLTVYLLT